LEAPRSTLSLADNGIMATTWPPVDEINAYNDDLIMAISKAIVGNTITIEKSSDFIRRFFWD